VERCWQSSRKERDKERETEREKERKKERKREREFPLAKDSQRHRYVVPSSAI